MKNLLTIALCALSFAAFAAEAPTVRVDNLGNAYRINADGSETNLGAPFDAMANHLAANPALGSAIQQAANVALANFKADTAAQIAAKEAEKQTAIAAAEQARDAAIAANASALASAQEAAATVPAKDAEIAAKTATIAEKEAALSAAQAALASKEAELAEKTAALAAKATYVAALRGQLIGAGLTPVEETP